MLVGSATTILGLFLLAVAAGASGLRLARIVYPLCCLAGLGLTGMNAIALFNAPASLHLPLGLPGNLMVLRLDKLAAFFGVIVNLGAAIASLYAIGYGRHERNPGRILPFFPAFLAAMNLVLLADDAYSFLLAWESMSLTSWALVLAHHAQANNRHAGYVYLLMAAFGSMALLFAFGALAGAQGSYGFEAIRHVQRPAWTQALVLVMTMIGAGSKAGLVPLHVWLPLAHPAAPSHVSALMSGVMTKVALYGMIRILFDLSGPTPWWWAVPLLLSGSVTAVWGILAALLQQDLKRLLAFSTIENIGVIVIALGLALAFRAGQMPVAAAVAVTAGLLHCLNHSLFKSLLFLGSGAVLHATGLFDLEKMGGLIRPMAVTGWLVLVGCAAASALPPLNGFVSEWLLFQSILVSPDLPQAVLRFIIPAVGAMLALAAALAATCFVKLFGIAFLGRPRSAAAVGARECDRWSIAAMLILALGCLTSGLFAAPLASALGPLTEGLVGGRIAPQQGGPAILSLTPFTTLRSSYNAPILAGFMLLSGCLTAWFIHSVASRRSRRVAVWDCGTPDDSPRLQISASGFAQPLRRIFGGLIFASRDHVSMPAPGEVTPARLTIEIHDPIWDRLYAPLAGIVWWSADRVNPLQFLTIRRHLGLAFMALIGLLILVALWRA